MRKVLVTGATSGIGQALVSCLRQQGAQVVAIGRDPLRLKDLTDAGVDAYACNLADEAQVVAVLSKIWLAHPDIDTLINNAGVQYTPTLFSADFDYESVTEEVGVNFLAPVRVTVLSLPHFLGREGSRIVNMGSGLAFFPKTSSAVYCATKAAL